MKNELKCWEFFGCSEEECPVYKLKKPRCWLVPGTRCRKESQGNVPEKIGMCLECEVLRANIDDDSVQETLRVVNEEFMQLKSMVDKRDRESEKVNMELALGLSEVFEALKKISSGDPAVRIPDTSGPELITELKHIVNLTAEELGEIVNLSHEFAIGLAEHFDVLHRVSEGDLTARVCGTSQVELLEMLKKLTNQMIESAQREIAERKQAEKALKEARNGLEIRIKERTAELIRTNALLKQEIVERQLAEEALIRAKEDWENTFDAITDMVMLLDKEHQIIRVNRAVAEALNTAKETLAGKKCYEVIHRKSHPIKECPLMLTMKTLEHITAEITEPNIGGTFICSTSPLLDREGKLTGYTHTLKDITKSKHLEAQLRHAQKMEAVGTLAGGIAHDFNNLLMGIQGHISLMLMHIDSSHPHFKHFKGMEDMIERGADLTRQLLGFARGGKYEVKPTDLNELIDKSCEMFGRTKKEIMIHKKYQKGIWSVEVDQGQMEQVLLNLYVNAWQAMPQGGNLYIETINLVLAEDYARPFGLEAGNYVKISVADTGVGMDKATQQRIFEPFFTTKEVGIGTGLGLASVYGIIKNHDGIINVYSEKGKGTTFNIYLPASEKDVTLKEKRLADDNEPLRGTGTILLVDDEDMIVEVGQEMLTSMGYNVLPARSGKEAIEIYNANTDEIDMVILDMIMPDINGGDVYDTLKEINPEIKVLLSSGYSLDGKANKILERGCNGFIQKPFNIGQLSEALRKILHPDL